MSASSQKPSSALTFFAALGLLGLVMLTNPRAALPIGVVVVLGALLFVKGASPAAPITAFNRTFLGG